MPDRFGKISIPPTVPGTPVADEVKKFVPLVHSQAPKVKNRQHSRKRQGVFLWLAAVIAIFALYCSFGFLGIPYFLTNTLSHNFNKNTGMVFDPGHISFNPFTFHFTTDNARIITETGIPLATLQSLSADLAPFSLLRLDLVCNTVTLSELTLSITREQDGSYNFAKLLGPKQDGGPSEILNFSDLPFLFSLNNIAIKNGKILFLDLPTGKTHSIEKIQLDLPTFSNIPFQANQYLRPSFSAMINGSPVELSGQAHMADTAGQATTLTCDLHSLDLPVYAEYLPLNLPLLITAGKADGQINLLFDPASQQEDKLSIDFALQLSNSELQTADETVFIAAPATEVKGKLKPVSKTVVFSTLSTKEPVVQSVGSSLLLSVDSLFRKEKKAALTGTTAVIPAVAGTPFSLAIDDLLVQGGTFHHWKEKGAKQPEATWNDLQLSVKGYSSSEPPESQKDPGSFSLSGTKAGTASSFAWRGDLSSVENLSGIVNLSNMAFKDLLLSIGADQGLGVKGLAELKGQLTISFPQESGSTMSYKLAEAELLVQDFQLLDDKMVVLSAPTLKISSLATAYKTIQFGNISVQNGSVLLPFTRIPEIFKQFTIARYLLQEIDFTGQIIVIADEKGKQKTTYSDVSVKAKDLASPEKAKDNFMLSAKTTTGGVIEGNGDVRISPFSLTINTEFNGLAAAEVFPVMTHSSLLNSLTGTLAGKGSLSLPNKSFAGELQLSKANLRRSADSIFSWDDMILQGVNFTSEPFHLGIATTIIKQPQFAWQIRESDAGPIQQLASFFQLHLPAVENGKQSGEKTKTAISPVDIQDIQFNGGRILIQDTRLKPKWRGEVSDFSGNIKGIQLAASDTNSEFSFTGNLQEAPFTITGDMDLFAKADNGKFHLTLDNYPLASFHEQLTPLIDVNSKSGVFDLQWDCSAKDGQFLNSGSLLFSGVKPISEKSESALTLALLTGSDDKFRIDFDFPRTSPLGKTIFLEEIFTFFQTKVVKASLSPLLLASGDFSDLIGNEFIEFEPGQAILAEKDREILARYASLLTTHPQLGLELAGDVDRDVDTPAMKEHLEGLERKRVEGENQKRFAAWQQEKAQFEQRVAEQQKKQAAKGKIVENTIPPAVLKDYIPLQPKQVIVDDVMLLELAKKRSQFVHQYLTEQLAIQPKRLALSQLKKIAVTPTGQAVSGVKITLTAIK